MSGLVPVDMPVTPSLTEVIAHAARDPATDVGKMEKLLAMYERIEAIAAERAFNAAMAKAQSEMPKVLRDATNNHTHSKYETLDSLLELLTPVITSNGFAVSFSTADCSIPDHYRVTSSLFHSSGHSRTYQADIPSDAAGMKGNANKSATQAFGSTMSYGRRYLLKLIFNIRTGDDDDGNTASGGNQATISAEQVEHLQSLIERSKADIEKFCAFAGVTSLNQIKSRDYNRAIDALNARMKQQAKP